VIETNFTEFTRPREGARRMIAAGSKQSERGRIIPTGSITADMTGQGDPPMPQPRRRLPISAASSRANGRALGINVNVIQPGYIRTEIDGDWFDSEGGKAQIASWPRRRLADARCWTTWRCSSPRTLPAR
jgi:NAD(P)-dependent dehydrogenase (short-subunit alcohol dehydrogenase family)